MSHTVIQIDNLWKKYRLGVLSTGTLVHDLNRWWSKFRGKPDPCLRVGEDARTVVSNSGAEQIDGAPWDLSHDEVWALRGISLQIERGEVVGIIGRNGAGKSTLLKVLSRVTTPSHGQIHVKGRVASLLEIGTGFHPELTGRENAFLNGTILGMTKAEVRRKLDEIIDFSGVEKFIDTPVKRYSSGMCLRLAFSVAAHLEPEILVVDEVLAVGDAEFQKKCLGKMGEVSKAGRTVLFVSHNMQAVKNLCSTLVLLENGTMACRGEPPKVIASYLSSVQPMPCEATWPADSAPGSEEFKLTGVRVLTQSGVQSGVCLTGEDIIIQMVFNARVDTTSLCVGFDLTLPHGDVVLRSYQTDLPPEKWPLLHVGENEWSCTIPAGLLNAGVYHLSPRVGIHNQRWIVYLDSVLHFETILNHGGSPFWNSLDGRSRPGVVAPILCWTSKMDQSTRHRPTAERSGDP